MEAAICALLALGWVSPLPPRTLSHHAAESAALRASPLMGEASASRRAMLGVGIMAATSTSLPAHASRSKLVPKKNKDAAEAAREYRNSAEAGEGMTLEAYQLQAVKKAKNQEKEYEEQQRKIAAQISAAASKK
ncbi:hypothetical protein AB1Y20_008899 [Prymnesium parvum]|uniref:ATPase family AAA domain-containing protein n=1 Tax=Prymnesium parvum TaxID=97485 RepID=A0AB34K0K4_PRYPA